MCFHTNALIYLEITILRSVFTYAERDIEKINSEPPAPFQSPWHWGTKHYVIVNDTITREVLASSLLVAGPRSDFSGWTPHRH